MERDRTIRTAVVVGGSFGGLAAAAVVAGRAEEVVVLEHRPLPAEGAAPASVSPQGGAPHLLLAGGGAAIDRTLPGYTADLVAHGAVGGDGPFPCHWWAAGGLRRTMPDLGVAAPFCTRALAEDRLRSRVRDLPNTSLVDGAVVRGLRVEEHRVVGVELERDGTRTVLDADLVVDASGRGSRAAAWLRAAAATPPPPTRRVEVDVTYTTVFTRRRPSDLGGGRFAVVQNTPALPRIGVALAAEGDRWQIVLGGYFGDSAPPTREGMSAFAASLPDPALVGLLEGDWLTEPAQFHFPSSQHRRWERVRRPVAGFCAVGDAVASFNPLYGQGMSAAALQAEALGLALDRVGNSRRLPRVANRAIAKVVANPWQIATGADLVYPQTRGHRPRGTDLVNRYLDRVIAAAAEDEQVNLAFLRVQQLLAPPATLFAPAVVRRVRRATRRAVRIPGPIVDATPLSAGSGARP